MKLEFFYNDIRNGSRENGMKNSREKKNCPLGGKSLVNQGGLKVKSTLNFSLEILYFQREFPPFFSYLFFHIFLFLLSGKGSVGVGGT